MVASSTADVAVTIEKKTQGQVDRLANPDPRGNRNPFRFDLWPLGVGIVDSDGGVGNKINPIEAAVDRECLADHSRAAGQFQRIGLTSSVSHQLHSPNRLDRSNQHGRSEPV